MDKHRATLASLLLTVGCASTGHPAAVRAAAAPLGPGAESGFSDVNTDPAMITDGRVTAAAGDLLATASALRRHVAALGGRVFKEQQHFRAEDTDERGAWAHLLVKVQPGRLPDLLDWLRERTSILSQDVESLVASEADADAQVSDPGAPDASGARRPAVLAVDLVEPPDRLVTARVVPAVRASWLGLAAPPSGGAATGRAGVALGIGLPVAKLEVAVYPGTGGGAPSVVLATLGAGLRARAATSGGRGTGRLFAGLRLGYAHLGPDDHRLAAGAELGLDVVRRGGVAVTTSLRPLGLLGRHNTAALEAGATLAFAF
jgi:hypothetical protein